MTGSESNVPSSIRMKLAPFAEELHVGERELMNDPSMRIVGIKVVHGVGEVPRVILELSSPEVEIEGVAKVYAQAPGSGVEPRILARVEALLRLVPDRSGGALDLNARLRRLVEEIGVLASGGKLEDPEA